MVPGSLSRAVVLATVAILSGCSTSLPSKPVVTPTTTKPASRVLPILDKGKWQALGSKVHGVSVTYVVTINSGKICLLWLDPKMLHFRFIPGTQVPENSPVQPIDNVRSSWISKMAAAFNGGFWLKDLHPGGYFYDGKVVKQLAVGQAAMVVTASGQLQVGMWGRDFKLTKDVIAVRESMTLIVDNNLDESNLLAPKLQALLHASASRNRSALGQFTDGSLVYEYGRGVTLKQMVQGLVNVHAQKGMMLDMNGDWPGAFVYTHQGSRVVGTRIHPRTYHNPSMYFTRYKKDFVVALLR